MQAHGSQSACTDSLLPDSVEEPLAICEVHLVTRDDAPSDCTNSYRSTTWAHVDSIPELQI